MKILIVEDDVINSSKLKLVYTKYGECDIAASGSEAIEMFSASYEISAPYDFISLETEMKEMTGANVLAEFRKYETENQIPPEKVAKILLITSQGTLATLASYLNQPGISHIIKPYNRKKLETHLTEIGIDRLPESLPTGPPPAAPAPPPRPVVKEEKRVDVDPAEAKRICAKMTSLLDHPEQLEGRNLQQIFEELVKRGGNDAELLMGQYISSEKLPLDFRIELIRSAGTIKSPHFLIPLNKVINSEDNIKLIQEAFLAIAKYCNQRALNLLNQGLQKFKHPMLMNTIRAEITKIKETKPVLGILPRFLQSYTNLKNFRVTVDILKKIIKPDDAELLTSYLKSANNVIGDGTFEILCHSSDETVKTALLNYFDDRVRKIPCLGEKECFTLYQIVSHLSVYLQRFPQFIDEQVTELIELYPLVADISVKHTIIAILATSQRPDALEFLKNTYNQEEALQEHIIDKLSGNQQAVDFLFEKYHSGKILKEKVITSLLKSQQGQKYFIEHFFTFDLEQQEAIVKNISFSQESFLMEFLQKIYDSDLYRLKFLLLRTLRENFLFKFKEILFDEKNQREFIFMGKDYFVTILHLFPVTSAKMFFQKIAEEDLSNNKAIKYLDYIIEVGISEPVLQFRSGKLIERLFSRISNANNVELNALFFKALENIKTLDLKTYRMLREATQTFTEVRGANINEKEKIAINRFMKNLQDQFPEIRQIESMLKELNIIFSNKPIILERLEKLIEGSHAGVALKILYVTTYLASKMKSPEYFSKDDKELFVVKYPVLAKFINHVTQTDSELKFPEDWSAVPDNLSLLNHFKSNLRIVLTFQDKWMSAFLKDQLQEIIPEFEVVMDTPDLKDSDLLVADPPGLRSYINRQALATNRIFLYLESRVDFAPFRSYNPKAFIKPLSGYRLVRLLLDELYLPR